MKRTVALAFLLITLVSAARADNRGPLRLRFRLGVPGFCDANPIQLLGISADGRMLFAAGETRVPELHFWDARSGQARPSWVLPALPSPPKKQAYADLKLGNWWPSTNGALCFVRDARGSIEVWDSASGQLRRTVQSGTGTPLCGLAVSANGKWEALVPESGPFALVREVATKKEVWRAKADFRPAGGASGTLWPFFSPFGTFLIAARGSEIRIFDAADGRPVSLIGAPERGGDRVSITDCALSYDEKFLAYVDSASDALHLCDPKSGKELRTIRGSYTSLKFSPDRKLLAAVECRRGGCEIYVWNLATPRTVHHMPSGTDQGCSLAFGSTGSVLYSGGHDGRIRRWNPHTGERLDPAGDQAQTVTRLCFSPDGKYLAAGGPVLVRGRAFPGKGDSNLSAGGKVHIWDLSNGIQRKEFGTSIQQIAYDSDGKLASVDRQGHVDRWDPISGAMGGGFTYASRNVDENAGHGLELSPNGRIVLTGELGNPGSSRILDVATGKETGVLNARESSVVLSARSPRVDEAPLVTFRRLLSPDGRLVAECARQRRGSERWLVVRVVSLVTGQEMQHGAVKADGTPRFLLFASSGLIMGISGGSFTRVVRLGKGASRPIHLPELEFTAAAASTDGRLLALGDVHGMVHVLDLTSNKLVHNVQAQFRPLSALAFSADAKILAGGTMDGTMAVWDLEY